MSVRIHSFPPVVRPDAQILILGSMPSVASLADHFYYAHPRNAFWRILSDSFGTGLPVSVPEKKDLLWNNGIALWDVLASCEREGSLDSDIGSPESNDFERFFASYPMIDRLLFNGSKAKSLFMRFCKQYLEDRSWQILPSTSPAYTLSYERKLAIWRRALEK